MNIYFFLKTETNMARILPLRLCTSFMFLGGVISIMARILSGLASMPLWDTMNPRNFPAVTLKARLPGLSFML